MKLFNIFCRIFPRKKKAYERDAGFYDDLFRSGGHCGQYHVHYSESHYIRVWKRGAEILSSLDNPDVLDIGCGPGQFAHLLYDTGIKSYKGVDHSEIAVEMAQKNVPEWKDHFTVNDAFVDNSDNSKPTAVVIFEVLEHLEHDRELLAKIPSGTLVLFSVPSYGSASHVRQFKSLRSVKKRYLPIVDIISLEQFDSCPEEGKTIYLVHGIRK